MKRIAAAAAQIDIHSAPVAGGGEGGFNACVTGPDDGDIKLSGEKFVHRCSCLLPVNFPFFGAAHEPVNGDIIKICNS